MVFFIACALFLLGVFIPSVGFPFWASLAAAALSGAVLFWFGWKLDARRSAKYGAQLGALAILLVVGTVHYNLDDYRYRQAVLNTADKTEFLGIIVTDPARGQNSQTFYLQDASHPSSWKILVRTRLYPEYFYGDKLLMSGSAIAPDQDASYAGYAGYLAKERIHARMFFPAIERISQDRANPLIAASFRLKHSILELYRGIFTNEQAAFLAGVTISANEDFSDEFLKNLSLSGTRHLIAVSGLNITIVIAIMWLALSYFLPKRVVFLLTFLAVGCLVAMTGFMVSAVRAAIMGFIAWSAREMIFRPHAVHNSLAFAAAGLVALNPKILVFDIGFQLSFLATAAIIYFAPALKSAFSPSKPSLIHVLGSDLQNREQGFLNWKESFWVTVAAQLAVAPVLISVFQNFSLTSFAANALILPVIPIVMTLGFLIGIAGLIFEPLALAFVFAVYPLIEYAMFLINIFGALAIEFNPQLGLVGTLIYYAVLMFASWKFYNKRTNA